MQPEKLDSKNIPNHYHLGLPAWGFPGWKNTFFDATKAALNSYTQVFSTVEGNTTFYHIPDTNTVAGWRDAVQGTSFKFCFKLPRSVTHERTPNRHDLDLFIERMLPLQANLGPFLVQFPATVGADQLKIMDVILSQLPDNWQAAIEVRHTDFFDQPGLLEPLLAKHKTGRIIMDTRAVFEGNTQHPEVQAALHKKPDLPVPNSVYNNILMVRLLLHPDLTTNTPYIDQWSTRIAKALVKGCDCYMMIHCPNNQHCPLLALQFHNTLRRKLDALPALAPWPIPQQQQLL